VRELDQTTTQYILDKKRRTRRSAGGDWNVRGLDQITTQYILDFSQSPLDMQLVI